MHKSKNKNYNSGGAQELKNEKKNYSQFKLGLSLKLHHQLSYLCICPSVGFNLRLHPESVYLLEQISLLCLCLLFKVLARTEKRVT